MNRTNTALVSVLDRSAMTMELVVAALARALDEHDNADLYRIATAAVDILDATARECRSSAVDA